MFDALDCHCSEKLSNLGGKRKKKTRDKEKGGKRNTLTELSPFPKGLCENQPSEMCPKEGTPFLKPLSLWFLFIKVNCVPVEVPSRLCPLLVPLAPQDFGPFPTSQLLMVFIS